METAPEHGNSSATRWPRALVIGASSGIGRAIAERLAAEGSAVAIVARRRDLLDEIVATRKASGSSVEMHAYQHDVRNWAAVPELFQKIAFDLGGLDLVVYAAGTQPVVEAEAYPTHLDQETITVNFGGAVAWLNAAADRFARAGEGAIVGIGSVAGDRGRRGNPVYGATKAALDTYLSSLRSRLASRHVTVLCVRPGFVDTALFRQFPAPGFVPVCSPDEAARLILRAAEAHKRIAYIPGWWKAVMLAIRAIPAPIFERLNV